MKRVLLLTLEYPPDRGGVARYLADLHASLPQVIIMRPQLWKCWPRWLPVVIKLFSQIKSEQVELVAISHVLPLGYAALPACWFHRVPFVVFVHGLDIQYATRTAWKRFWLRTIFRCARTIVANSQYTKSLTLPYVDVSKVSVCHPCVPSIAPARKKENGSITLLTVARLVKRKNIHSVLDALQRLKQKFSDLRYVVVGDGPEREFLAQKIKTDGLREIVTIVRDATDDERDGWYEAADIFVLPALSRGDDVEGFGIVYLEAARFGLPVIAGRGGGVGEAVEDGRTGILVDPQDVEALERALIDLITHPEKRKDLGAAGRQRVEKYFLCHLRKKIMEQLYA